VFRYRLIVPELLDHAAPDEAKPNLEDLIRINRRFGGHSVLRRTLAKILQPSEQFTMLDVGAASGDSARVIASEYPGGRITNLDYNDVNLEAAPKPKIIADAFLLPFREQSFDYVFCSLFLHHFAEEKVIHLLRTLYATARHALIVCDLERHILPYLFLPATRPFFGWGRITLHDGPVSVRAAFRKEELEALAQKAGITNAEFTVYRPAFRITMVARKPNRK
jgi:SAM-dependent methyltransferase